MMGQDHAKNERFLRRNFRTVASRGGMVQPDNVHLIHGSLLGLRREREVPALDDLARWAEEEGVQPDDIQLMRGVALAVLYGERDFGRLAVEAPEGDLAVKLTVEESRAARGALFLVLYGPFCNFNGHRDNDIDPFWETHTITGFWEHDFRFMLDALDDRLPPRQ